MPEEAEEVERSLSGALAWPLSGWQLSTVFKANDGVPFSALFGAQGPDPRGTLSSDDYAYPSAVPGCNPIDLNFRNDPNGPLYISPKTSCFTVPQAPNQAFWTANCDPAPPTFGGPLPAGDLRCFNLGGNPARNILVGPGISELDFSVFKNMHIPLRERSILQFRAEFFNILNHTNFLAPGFLNTFGQNNSVYDFDGSALPTALNQTATTSRQIQLGMKLTW